MRFVTYRARDGTVSPGVIEGDAIQRISTPSLRDYIALAPHERIAWHSAEELVALTGVRLEAPVRPPRNVICVGRNYLEHAKEGARAAGRELKLPSVPTFFTKASTAIAGPEATLHLQAKVSGEYDYEAELAVVIGAKCKDVAEAEALHVVFGYTALNDVTARDLQREHGQWFKGKSLDDCCPIGPWIVSPEEIGDAQALEIAFRLNGVEKQRGNTADDDFRHSAIDCRTEQRHDVASRRRHRDRHAVGRRFCPQAARVSGRRRRHGNRDRKDRRAAQYGIDRVSALPLVGGIVALALVIVGIVALAAPHRMAHAYGLPLDGNASRGFARATGIRDVAIGVALGAAVYYHDVPLLVVLAAAGVILSLTDLAIAAHAGGWKLRREHGVHVGGVIAFVLVLTMALFAIGW